MESESELADLPSANLIVSNRRAHTDTCTYEISVVLVTMQVCTVDGHRHNDSSHYHVDNNALVAAALVGTTVHQIYKLDL